MKRSFNYELFKGALIHLNDAQKPAAGLKLLSESKSVKRAWPVSRHRRPDTRLHWVGNNTQTFAVYAKNQTSSAYSPHVMTQVDMLHQAGYTGKGATIALLDTGVSLLALQSVNGIRSTSKIVPNGSIGGG